VRKTARYFGVCPSTVSRWVKKDYLHGLRPIPTKSSRPHHHPHQLKQDIIDKIIELRKKHKRYAEVIHKEILNLGYSVSLSSVKRVLKRHYLLKRRSPWKRWHFEKPKPEVEKPGDLVQIDTIHLIPGSCIFILSLMFSQDRLRLRCQERLILMKAFSLLKKLKRSSSYPFSILQSDHLV